MGERPLLMSAPMVRAILAGTKSQTRRLVTVPWKGSSRTLPYEPWYIESDGKLRVQDEYGDFHTMDDRWSPYGVPGDRLWVRETWYDDNALREREPPPTAPDEFIEYRASHDCSSWEAECPCRDEYGRSSWRPSIFMPRWASRITLEVTEVRVQRLQDISREDAIAEGMPHEWQRLNSDLDGYVVDCKPDPYAEFALFWDSINGQREGASWADNPWVWAIGFKRIEASNG